ncbi:MAG: MBL fold metallo-hydrolase [Candidatus Parabeggiatoa sp. nov. 2]|nr:MAG: MBL fold hydrolase [Beggiatoa sp. 4572_84]RKZ53515.1 MAG: MBL fold metallo-hydrolase [Gammaproteobacteria bacterium]HEC85178.1 MBL fold metallo-hydrolase [Thioploca sp.]
MILHHGGLQGVTGSCHELRVDNAGILVDCGLFQGDDHSTHGIDSAHAKQLNIDFAVDHIKALIVTHAHIDHIGRIPYLLAAGFHGPIYCSQATALLLPLMLEDAVKIGLTSNRRLVKRLINKIEQSIISISYQRWETIELTPQVQFKIKFKPAGHILGSAYVECDTHFTNGQKQRVIFSGDLGAPYAPLIPAPKSPYACDTLVLESTYGDRSHPNRKQRRQVLKQIIERCVRDKGAVLIPAFSLGRTQELLYEFEQIIHRHKRWDEIEIIIDSPLANRLTEVYKQLKPLWDKEARRTLQQGRHPLSFEQLLTINDWQTHQRTVNYLQKTARPVIVIAASGMCNGGRIVNYLKALIEDKRTDILFVGYQGQGTIGRTIQKYGPDNGWVEIEGQRYTINAQVHTISGYSAHADQQNLINFVKRMRHKPKEIRLVHGDEKAKQMLAKQLAKVCPQQIPIIIPKAKGVAPRKAPR